MKSIRKEDRKFRNPYSISNVLKCSICLQVFHEPSRLFCGHTFCFQCLQQWSKSQKQCPVCRTGIISKNLGKDLIAFNIINDQQVFCTHEDCSWIGPLQMLQLHISFECLYQDIKKITSAPNNMKVVDEEVESKINENAARGNLLSRVLMKENGLKNGKSIDLITKIIKTDSSTRNSAVKKTDLLEGQDSNHSDSKAQKYEAYNFLEQLYESSK